MTQETEDRKKWMSMLESSTDRDTLEAMGNRMTADLLLETLEWAAHQAGGAHQRLLPIIAATPQKMFAQGFTSFTSTHMEVLKRLASEEPLQHHLTLLMHGWAHEAEERANFLEQLRKQITDYDVKSIDPKDYENFKKSIDEVVNYFQNSIALIDKALVLAWNTPREDLIDRLTTLKENWLRYSADVLGHESGESTRASGVYKELDTHFNLVFGNASNLNELAALEDSDPGIEALAALSIWNAQDYHNLGLLPQHEHVSETDLVKTVQTALDKLGLATVADFKHRKIYSKKALQGFIEEKKNHPHT